MHDIIKNLKNKATLDTKIGPLKIANSNFMFTDAIAKVVTASFQEGVFPQQLKLARVVPVFKSGSKCDESNYRPISLLHAFSKIFEKLMHNRVTQFMENNKSLHDMQFGFRAGRSCEHALLTATNSILHSLNKNQVSLLLLIDFSKAFDMVEHSILIKKLANYGIRGNTLEWFKSYLSDREQFVYVNGTKSSTKKIKYGVPQGSILGPLLFVIYINDLPNIYQLAKFVLYADDANIIVSGETVSDVMRQLSELAPALVRWVECNGLKLNLKKTNYMIFSKQHIPGVQNVFINGTRIERKPEARFLGVIMDEKLTWAKHIKAMRIKMNRYIGIMYKLKSLLPLKARLQIYHSFVQSHLNFCPLVWGFAAKSHIETLFSGQKKGLRATAPGFNRDYYKEGVMPTHTKPFFAKYNILSVHNIIAINALLFMHKVRHFPEALPQSVRATIASNSPKQATDHISSEEWLSEYGNSNYSKSIFFKGPMLHIDNRFDSLVNGATLLSYKTYRAQAKTKLLKIQCTGETDSWQADNFVLLTIHGLRRSSRLQQ